MYITYEEPYKGKRFTEKRMKKLYKNIIDKQVYPDYEDWKYDMLKSGIFEKVDEGR